MLTKIGWRERFFAAAIHFLVTAMVATIVAGLIFFVWFPGGVVKIEGGHKLFSLVVCSDLVLGPLISLVIFNTKKSRKELIIDYFMVGTIQLAALVYGVSVVAESRPVFVAFVVDRFEVVAAIELDDADLAQAGDTYYGSRSWLGSRLVSVQLPTEVKERNEILFTALGGKDIYLFPKYYQPYKTAINEIEAKSESLQTLIAKHPEQKEMLGVEVKELGFSAENLRWLPVHNRFGFWTALIDTSTGYPVKYLPIDPY